MTRTIITATLFAATRFLAAQGPEVTGWIINPGAETGYGGELTNVLAVNYTDADVYVSCTCIPGYDIGPWAGNPNIPANQDFTFRITRAPAANTGTPVATPLGHVGAWRNGVSIFNAKDGMSWNNQGIWNRNALVFEGSSFDECLGHPAPNGEYHHHVNPVCLYDATNGAQHSPLIGYAFDGFPVYGAFAYANTDGTGGIARMRSSYRLREITERTTLADGTALTSGEYGPAIGGQYALGAFIEDHEYVEGLGDLDGHNGRFCVTPEYPQGTYAYFVTIDEDGLPVYPYVLGPTYYGTVQQGNTGPQSGHNTVPGGAENYDPSVTGIAEQVEGDDLVLYPVPTEDVLNVRTDGRNIGQVEVRDAAGRITGRWPGRGPSLMIDPAGWATGVYVLRVLLEDGSRAERVFVKR